MITVLIADDEALIRSGFSMILGTTADIEVVGEAPTGEQAVEAARRLRPDVVLMDIKMPGAGGIEATRRVVEEADSRVVVVTTFGHDEYVRDALRAGASGFLLKNATPEQLVDGIRAAARGDAMVSPEVTRQLIEALAAQPAPPAEVAARFNELTERETDVLRLLAHGQSNAEIAEELVVTEATVKTHVTRILMKLEVRDRTQAAIAAHEAGVV